MTSRWWSATRVLVMGLALALVVAASAEGCEEGGNRSAAQVECPGVGEMLSVAVAWLPQEELAEDLEYAKRVAERVANAENGTCTRADNGLGYNVTIHYTRVRDIHVRVMARSAARRNYYRVAIDGLGAVDRKGEISHRAAATHHRSAGFPSAM